MLHFTWFLVDMRDSKGYVRIHLVFPYSKIRKPTLISLRS